MVCFICLQISHLLHCPLYIVHTIVSPISFKTIIGKEMRGHIGFTKIVYVCPVFIRYQQESCADP